MGTDREHMLGLVVVHLLWFFVSTLCQLSCASSQCLLLFLQAVIRFFLSHMFSQIMEENLGESFWFLAGMWGVGVGDASNLQVVLSTDRVARGSIGPLVFDSWDMYSVDGLSKSQNGFITAVMENA